MSLPVDPPNVWVARNQWTDIPVPDVGDWTPKKPLSVVLPYFERSHELNLTLAGLSEQTYPHHLLQVIVADDGSTRDPPNPPSDLPFDLEVLWQEDRGYGLARARNLGAKAAEGEIIVFLDCDMIPERQHLEAHARWHHAARRLVTVGFRLHADFGDETPEHVAGAVAEGSLSRLSQTEIMKPEWIEGHMLRTSDMLGPHEDFYLMMSGGNIGIDRDLYWEAGGNDETFTRWGGEDNEFGYRVMQLGAVVVPERLGLAWHQGEGHEPSEEELDAIWRQRAKLKNLIASPGFRQDTPGRMYTVPRLLVSVRTDGQDPESISKTVDSILSSKFTDLVVGLERPNDALEAEWLEETYRSDGRVRLWMSESDLVQQFPFSPIRLSLPAGYVVGRATIGQLVDQTDKELVGAIHLTLPGRAPWDGAELVRTRAFNRARFCNPDAIESTVGSLFGERWLSGPAAGFQLVDDWVDQPRSGRVSDDPDSQYLEEELLVLQKELEMFKSRRSLKLADALGGVRRARSVRELRSAVAGFFRSLR